MTHNLNRSLATVLEKAKAFLDSPDNRTALVIESEGVRLFLNRRSDSTEWKYTFSIDSTEEAAAVGYLETVFGHRNPVRASANVLLSYFREGN